MTLAVQVTASSVLPETKDAFERQARLVYPVFEDVRNEAHIPAYDLKLLLTDDFVGDVTRLMKPFADGTPAETFTTDRVGGTPVAKNLPQTADSSVAGWIRDYNQGRQHQALKYRTAREVRQEALVSTQIRSLNCQPQKGSSRTSPAGLSRRRWFHQ